VIEGLSETAADELPSQEDIELELRTLLDAGVSPSEVRISFLRRTLYDNLNRAHFYRFGNQVMDMESIMVSFLDL